VSSLPVAQLTRLDATVRRASLSRFAAARVTARLAFPGPVETQDTVNRMPRDRNARTEDGTTSSADALLVRPCGGAVTTTCTVAEPVAPSGSVTVTFAL
jgi:hypothetical protein